MSPYRQPDEISKQEEEKRKRRAELSMFGVRQGPDGEWKPILERVETNQCRDCRGYGTHGNPLCGAVYNCERCKGSGYDPDPVSLPKPKQSFWDKVVQFFRGQE